MNRSFRLLAVGGVCAAAISALSLMIGCTRSAQTAPPVQQPEAQTQSAPAGPVAAKDAFWPMYKAAHAWASDVTALRLSAKTIPGVKNESGKAAMWEAVFASPSKATYRTFTWSVADVPSSMIYKGVNAGLEMPWGGATRDVMPIDLSQFNTDSDAAYQAAAADGAEWLKKNPGKDLSALEMGDTYRFQVPVWHVMWGTKSAGYAAWVDASSGKVLKH
ncbi:MAG TPA: hypothetical protein VHX37_14425 [Acidobacteriaceae bacterium]|jgi:hypothetical protein|nr:hypothetical protein [Acidobacteriaceae bacterium]